MSEIPSRMQEVKTPEDAVRLVTEQLQPLQAMRIAFLHVFGDHELGVPVADCELCVTDTEA